jgi:succinate dehydrogenase/fumarate reductase cytochrome b subunit
MNIGNTLFNNITSAFNPDPTSATPLIGIAKIVTLFLNIVFVLSGLILLFFFIMGGIGMISSAGANDPQKSEQAKKTITSAIIGFVIVFTSYWIVKLIGQLFGITNII